MFEKTIWAFETLSRDIFLSWVYGLGPEEQVPEVKFKSSQNTQRDIES